MSCWWTKSPTALQGELRAAIQTLKRDRPECKLILMLRDILDAPEATIRQWQRDRCYQAVARFYDRVWVVGMPEVFDVCREYRFPARIRKKVRFCGYIRRDRDLIDPQRPRQRLGVREGEKLVLVTAGGGGDGERLLRTYLGSVGGALGRHGLKHVIICGPDMPVAVQKQLFQIGTAYPQVRILEFTPDLMSYANAADLVVSMGGYNTVCEILSLGRRAVVVPRTEPVREQSIRATRMGRLGLFEWIHPDRLTPERLARTVLARLEAPAPDTSVLDFDALPRIAAYFHALQATLKAADAEPEVGSCLPPALPAREERSPPLPATSAPVFPI